MRNRKIMGTVITDCRECPNHEYGAAHDFCRYPDFTRKDYRPVIFFKNKEDKFPGFCPLEETD